MKKKFNTRLVKLGLLMVVTIGIFGTSVKAQSLDYKMRVNIPFDFAVGDHKLSAGQYLIGRAFPERGDLVLQIQSRSGRDNALPLTIPVTSFSPVNQGKLVFHHIGGEYFLAQVWPAAASTGRELPKSRAEKQALRRVGDAVGAAQKRDAVETVTVFGDLR